MYVRVTLGVVCGFVECYGVYGWGGGLDGLFGAGLGWLGWAVFWLGFMGLVLCVGLGVVVGCRCDYVGLGVGFSFVGVVLLG